MLITIERVREYVEGGGTWCPYCGDGDITPDSDSVDIDGGCATQTIECSNCHLRWTEDYRLVGIVDSECVEHIPPPTSAASDHAGSATSQRTRQLTIDLPDGMWRILDRLVAAHPYVETMDALVVELLDHVQQGVYRSGSWERGWLEQAIPLEAIEAAVTYHPPNERAKELHQNVRLSIKNAMIQFAADLPDCREASLAVTKLEEAMFWANAGIARNHDQLS